MLLLITFLVLLILAIISHLGLQLVLSSNPDKLTKLLQSHKRFHLNIQRIYGARFILGVIKLSAVIGLILVVSKNTSGIVAGLVIFVTLWALFYWSPSKTPKILQSIVIQFLVFIFVLETKLHSTIAVIYRRNHDSKKAVVKTDIDNLKQLIDFIKHQKLAENNQIDQAQLDFSIRSLEFNQEKVSKYMIKIDKVKKVGASESIGPVLINELHQTTRKYFPVEEEFNNQIIGTLDINSLTSLQKRTGSISDVMKTSLYYINENSPIADLVAGFCKTGSHVFLVVDKNEKIVGLASIEELINQLIGLDFSSDFDSFESINQAANHPAKPE